MKPDKDVTDSRLVKALAHPLRVRILGVLDERTASPSELADELGAPLGNVSYHVRILAGLELIRLVRETPRRGSVEHHYEAVARLTMSDEAWSTVPRSVKRAMVGAALEEAGQSVSAAAAAGGFNRPEASVNHLRIELDDEGWQRLTDELAGFVERAEAIARDAKGRLEEATTSGDPAMLVAILFGAEDTENSLDGDGPRAAQASVRGR